MTYGIGPNQRMFGPYTLIRRLAIGGMSEIWLAEQKGISGFTKRVVIKTILDYLTDDPELVEMFLDEGRIAAGLNHPNIAQIYDLGEIGESYYISMEYIQGRDLRYWLTANVGDDKEVPLALILKVAAEVCAGLHYAHTWKHPDGRPANIIHRDISPDNVICTFEGNVKIVDFGIAKASHQAKTKTGVLKGKYAYMSPEQVIGSPLDHRSDIFSLGVVIYELITGRRLFKRESEVDTLEAVSEATVPPPHTLDVNVPRQVETILMKALERDREARFADARQMQLAIERVMAELQMMVSSADLSAFMHEMFEAEEELGRENSAQVEKSLDEAPDVTSKASLTTPIRKTGVAADPGPTRAEPSSPRSAKSASLPQPPLAGRAALGDADDEDEDTVAEEGAWVGEDQPSGEEARPLADEEFSAEKTLDDAEPARRPLPRWLTIAAVLLVAGATFAAIELLGGAPERGAADGAPQAEPTTFRPRYEPPATHPIDPATPAGIDPGTPPPPGEPDAGSPPGEELPRTEADAIIAMNQPREEPEDIPSKRRRRARRRKLRLKKHAVAHQKPQPKTKPRGWCHKTYGPGRGLLDVGYPGNWGVVYIDGEKIRYTPLVKHELHAGRHGIELKDGEGHLIRRWCIRLRKGQHVKLLHQ